MAVYNNLPAGGGFTLLWTNSAPSTSFSPQTVTLDLTPYNFLYISFRLGTESDGTKTSALITKDTKFVLIGPHMSGSGGNYFRSVTATDTGVQFESGTKGGVGVDNNINIPYQIYGIK